MSFNKNKTQKKKIIPFNSIIRMKFLMKLKIREAWGKLSSLKEIIFPIKQ